MQTFSEKDLGASAFLLVRGHVFQGLEQRPDGFVAFVFNDPEGECHDDVLGYFNGAACAAQKFAIQLHSLKRRLRSEKERNGAYRNKFPRVRHTPARP